MTGLNAVYNPSKLHDWSQRPFLILVTTQVRPSVWKPYTSIAFMVTLSNRT